MPMPNTPEQETTSSSSSESSLSQESEPSESESSSSSSSSSFSSAATPAPGMQLLGGRNFPALFNTGSGYLATANFKLFVYSWQNSESDGGWTDDVSLSSGNLSAQVPEEDAMFFVALCHPDTTIPDFNETDDVAGRVSIFSNDLAVSTNIDFSDVDFFLNAA